MLEVIQKYIQLLRVSGTNVKKGFSAESCAFIHAINLPVKNENATLS
jgi:hypothetical protein